MVNTDNTHNIVKLENVSDQTIIDGFTISDALGNSFSTLSGGVFIRAVGTNETSSPKVKNCNITNNNAAYGGGVTILATNSCEASPSFIYCKIDSNSAFFNGGGLYFDSHENAIGHLTISNSSFNDNISDTNGGGLYLRSSLGSTSSFNMSSSFVQGNVAYNGGGVYIYAYDAIFNPHFTNSVITGNLANNDGGAILISSGKSYEDNPEAKLTLINCTIARNKADGTSATGGIKIEGSLTEVDADPIITNTLVDKNGTLATDNLAYASTINPAITYSYVTGITVAGTADSNFTTDPHFILHISFLEAPSSGGNYGLSSCFNSSIINKGNNLVAPAFDIQGKPRINEGRIEPGAYEYDGSGLISTDFFGYFDALEKVQIDNFVDYTIGVENELNALKSIDLLPGFEVEQGVIFSANIKSEICVD